MQDRIVEQLAQTDLLVGTVDDLADRLGMTPDELRSELRALAQVGTVAVQTQPGGYLRVRLERRQGGAVRARHDRRRVPADEWRL
jgi:hypothetical protein